ncbi:L-aspartate oxidase [Sinomonas mesophila]|uniref:L-aspartate oxidase n=1 Tax=Sinomonas mesophila TaxID=1531955 RepID=UPI001FE5A268|nr:L-aspartate oxidase [Sinomonas mesophila]
MTSTPLRLGAPGRTMRSRTTPTRRLVVVGSGVAGLVAAIRAAAPSAGAPSADVVLLTKAGLEDSNSMLAQGGFAAVLPEGQRAPGDTVASHVADTLAAGAGHGDRAAVEAMCARAAEAVDGLMAHGVVFDRGADGRLALGLEAAHAFPRILHAGGDASGAGITRALADAVRLLAAQGRVEIVEGAMATELVLDAGRVAGVEYVAAGARHVLDADAVLLATGGAGQLFAQTTNPAVATGDGVALAFRAGALLADLEFYQFHPTALQTVGPDGRLRSQLVSEAVRGEGAVIRDARGRRFVADYHPLGELAPRDAVSRALALHRRAGHGQAFLDATGLEDAHGRGFLARRFPGLDAMTRAAGFDWRRELLPIGPAAHYWMGGIVTDLDGATSIPGLYAAGEAARTGVHGANRLASNSLLEGAVFAARAVEHFLAGEALAWPAAAADARTGLLGEAGGARLPLPGDDQLQEPEFSASPELLSGDAGRARLAAAMEADAGVLRDADGLARLARTLGAWSSDDPETANLLTLGRLLTAAASAREESLGAHFRLDFPQRRLARRADPLTAVGDQLFGETAASARIGVVRQPALAGRTA